MGINNFDILGFAISLATAHQQARSACICLAQPGFRQQETHTGLLMHSNLLIEGPEVGGHGLNRGGPGTLGSLATEIPYGPPATMDEAVADSGTGAVALSGYQESIFADAHLSGLSSRELLRILEVSRAAFLALIPHSIKLITALVTVSDFAAALAPGSEKHASKLPAGSMAGQTDLNVLRRQREPRAMSC